MRRNSGSGSILIMAKMFIEKANGEIAEGKKIFEEQKFKTDVTKQVRKIRDLVEKVRVAQQSLGTNIENVFKPKESKAEDEKKMGKI